MPLRFGEAGIERLLARRRENGSSFSLLSSHIADVAVEDRHAGMSLSKINVVIRLLI
jgi:hypothetical protein